MLPRSKLQPSLRSTTPPTTKHPSFRTLALSHERVGTAGEVRRRGVLPDVALDAPGRDLFPGLPRGRNDRTTRKPLTFKGKPPTRLTTERSGVGHAAGRFVRPEGLRVDRERRHVMIGSMREPEMTADDVCGFLDLTEAHGIRFWVDRGLGARRFASALRRGVTATSTSSSRSLMCRGRWPLCSVVATPLCCVPIHAPRNFVLGDDAGHQVDFHVIVLGQDGRGIYGPPENGESYAAEALTGKGTINGRTIDCITPEWLVQFHTGYQPDGTDWADVSALSERFGVPVPSEYLGFRSPDSPFMAAPAAPL
jgi:lincosamide nucleotidyltransferase A/C/D/E